MHGTRRLNDFFLSVSVLLAVASMYLMRPSFFGENYNFLGCCLFLVASLGVFVNAKVSRPDMAPIFFRCVPFFVLWIYFVIQSQVKGVASPFPFYGFILCVIVCLGCVLIFSSPKALNRFIEVFIVCLAIIGLSSFVTFVSSIFVPLYSLHFYDVVSVSYGEKPIFFPFSLGYEQKFYPFGLSYRFSLFWRESGIAQAIYCWAILVASQVNALSKRKWVFVSLIAGCAVTQSTIAYSNLALIICIWAAVYSKQSISIKVAIISLVLPFAIFLVYFSIFDENIGLMSKISGGSFLERFNAVENSLHNVYIDPWGYGKNGNDGRIFRNSSTNLIAQMQEIGVLGVFLVLVCWISAISISERKALRFFALLPIIITSITSQPLVEAFGILVILVMPNYADSLSKPLKVSRALGVHTDAIAKIKDQQP